MPEKLRKPRERVVTSHLRLTPEEWGRICSIPWTDATRPVIAALFAKDGGYSTVRADEACDGTWSRVMQANRLFIKYGLPYRIRDYELPDGEERYQKMGYWICRRGLRLETVTQTLG